MHDDKSLFPEGNDDEDRQLRGSMSVVLWIFVACAVLGLAFLFVIPW